MHNFFVLVFFVTAFLSVQSQGVGIHEGGGYPDPSAMLDVQSTSKGLLLPRMTTEQRDAILNPANGLQIFNTSSNCLQIYISPSWQNVYCGCAGAPSALSYTDNGPLVYCLNIGITPNDASTQTSNPTAYSISPALPAGLFLNSISGQITGTPTAISASATYTIMATNSCGMTSRNISIAVSSAPASPVSIAGPSAPTAGVSATYSTASVTGASSYNWTVPAGWSISSGQGTNSIEVVPGSGAGNITVASGSPCGTSASISRAITPWVPMMATGGNVSTYTANGTNGVNGVQYRVHRFTTTGASSFTVTQSGSQGTVDYLVIGGGGGGGNDQGGGGGGGAGGVRSTVAATGGGGPLEVPLALISGTTYTVVVGAGGLGATTSSGQVSTNGGNSSFATITSSGGGRGGGISGNGSRTGGLGGSGGGSGSYFGGPSGGSGISNQGYGGAAGTGGTAGGGGGGAGGAGQTGSDDNGGNGGTGILNNITGVSVAYAGGGAGCGYGTPGVGGSGIGGNAGDALTVASPNTGSGGGANRAYYAIGGGAGASGIVIVRYPITNPNP